MMADNISLNCSDKIFSDINAWRSSRAFLDTEIHRLRSQLFELKEIRKHLKAKKPSVTRPVEAGGESGLVRKRPCVCGSRDQEKKRSRHNNVWKADKARVRVKARAKARALRRKRRRQRLQLKKAKKHHLSVRRKKAEACHLNDRMMECFSHDNDHWKTAPLWTDGPFCACTNSNTNTYWCIRTINTTSNSLYCEFVTGTVMYFDLDVDPHQLRNMYSTLTHTELNNLHRELLDLRAFQGGDDQPKNGWVLLS